MMGSVVQAIEELGCKVMHIPGGCTCVLQPVDVGFNKPFKSGYHTPFRNWTVKQAILHGKIDCPSRVQVAEWILEASQSLTYQTLRNAWQRTGFEWFPKGDGGSYSSYDEMNDDEEEKEEQDEEIIEFQSTDIR